MTKINCYQTTKEQLYKAFCMLSEKCYYSELKTTVFTTSEDFSKDLDRVLWTYSKQHFIPHGTNMDSLQEKQPIYITSDTEGNNYSPIIIFVNATESIILKILSNQNKISQDEVKKILFIFDDAQNIKFTEIKNLIEKSYIKNPLIQTFIQNKQSHWQEVSLDDK